jgi:hypothetical protein
VAEALNAAGYRTSGNRGRNPFTKDTVCRLLQNRFYLGELPDGEGGSLPAAHQPGPRRGAVRAGPVGPRGEPVRSVKVTRRTGALALRPRGPAATAAAASTS